MAQQFGATRESVATPTPRFTRGTMFIELDVYNFILEFWKYRCQLWV